MSDDHENRQGTDAPLIKGRFRPGESGNPGGRPRRDRRTAEILDEANEPVLLAAVERALKGDVGAQRLILGRSAPAPKAPTAPVDLGPLASPVDCLAAMSRITAALAEGILDADMATWLTGVVAAGLKVVETVDLAEQVRELQRQMRESGR
jgi:hypothetical protein